MHGDFSRLTFNPLDRFSAVVALQGRVNMEADANEHTAIVQHYLHRLVVDLLGKHGWADHESFEVTLVVDNQEIEDISLSRGHCYVDGLLVQNTGIDGADASLYHQPDAYLDRDRHPLPDPPFFVYLDVWERLVTTIEQPRIRDVALGAGGPDSSARTKVVWQARAGASLDGPGLPATQDEALKYWSDHIEPKLLGADPQPGMMSARVQPANDDELCALYPNAGYTGLENQLYRVEIHHGGVLEDGSEDVPSFVWSRDNGSVVFPILEREGAAFTMTTLGRDDRYSLAPGQWVELVDDATVLNGDPSGDLRRVLHVDPIRRRVTLDAAPSQATGEDGARHPLLRRWDQEPIGNELGPDNAIVLRAGWIPLEDGIEVSFGEGTYRAGDFWVFPARVETGAIDWYPEGTSRPPDGVARRFVPLAYVTSATVDPIDLRAFGTTAATAQEERHLTLAPAFVQVGTEGWDHTNGVASKPSANNGADGLMPIDLPNGSVITGFRVVGKITPLPGAEAVSVGLHRAGLAPGAAQKLIAEVSVVAGDPFDVPKDVAASPLATIQSEAFKYFVTAGISNSPGTEVEVSAVQISYFPA